MKKAYSLVRKRMDKTEVSDENAQVHLSYCYMLLDYDKKNPRVFFICLKYDTLVYDNSI